MAKFKVIILTLLVLISTAIAALAADEQPLSAAAGLTTDSFTLILKIGVPSGLISAFLTLVGVILSNRSAQKNNREKIAAEAGNISRQLYQRQHEFEIQTKMQLESLHSDEKKKVCADFLASVNPSLFPNKQFDFNRMNSCISPLYLYCKDSHFSYFENLTRFITEKNLIYFGQQYEIIITQLNDINAANNNHELIYSLRGKDSSEYLQGKSGYSKGIENLTTKEQEMTNVLKLYTHHYELALEAAKKMIWNEPIEKAQPIQLENLPDEDDI